MAIFGKVIPIEGLRVRSGPGTENAILGVLVRDEPVVLFEMIGDWWRVECRFGAGFVHSAFVAPLQEPIQDEEAEEPEPEPIQPEPAEESYTCIAGDTLFSIGVRFRIDFRQIAVFNGLVEPFSIQVGQVLRIPRTGGGQPLPATLSVLNPFVVAGDTEVTSSSLQGHHRPWLGACSCDLDVRGVSSPGVPVHFNVGAPAGMALRGRVESVALACRSQRVADGGWTVRLAIEKRNGADWTRTDAWVLYAHIDPVAVAPGDIVEPGRSIGAMGPASGGEYNSSCAQGSHVHIEAGRAHCIVNQSAVIRNAPVFVLDV